MTPWDEYADLVDFWGVTVAMNPCRETYLERWRARLRHPSWEERREAFLWYTNSTCERCGNKPPPGDLQLHHLHYDTLWYENNSDLQLLCPGCHREADEERANEALTHLYTDRSDEERARAYMDVANRWSGQPDWPVTYREALAIVTGAKVP